MTVSLKPLIRFHLGEIDQLEASDPKRDASHQSLVTLRFAQALERKVEHANLSALPGQIVVIGPTQSGKSTLVNLLLGLDHAGVSELAGFTVHCQGFSVDPFDQQKLLTFFPDNELVEQGALQREALNQYSCTDVSHSASDDARQALANTLVWDTPDFDSVAQRSYRSPLFETVALADLVILVVSKEKYADRSVWDVLRMLAVAGKKTIFVINKSAKEVRDELLESIKGKLENLKHDQSGAFSPSIHFVGEANNPLQTLCESEDLLQLRIDIGQFKATGKFLATKKNVSDVVNYYWLDWTSSVFLHHQNQREWRSLIEQSCQTLLQKYEQEYLDTKRHDETLQLAVAELLVLLEVPGLAEPLTKVRSLVTWPVRKLLGTATAGLQNAAPKSDNRREEQRLLESLYDHSLIDLSAKLAGRQEKNDELLWWRGLHADLTNARPKLKKGWLTEFDNYQILLKVETESVARSLYKKLEEQPATLNSLRAARVTGDAAAVVLAVKSGGLGAADLVIAPAVLSLTTMLTESALGQYMKKVQQDLKRYQKKAVGSLVNRKFRVKLQSISDTTSVAITPEYMVEIAERYQLNME